MDFKRIQVIFIVTFVLIDIFLFSLFRQNRNVQVDNVNSNSPTDIVNEMRSDQITFNNPSNNLENGYYVSAVDDNSLKSHLSVLDNQNVKYKHNTLTSTFKRPIGLYNQPANKLLNNLIKDPTFVALGNQYQYSPQLSNNNNLIYVQKSVDNNQIYSGQAMIRFRVNNDHLLLGYTQSYLNNVHPLREKSNVISEERALTWLYQYNDIPNNSQIKWTKLSYTKLLSVKKNGVYIPTWVIAFKTNSSPVVQVKCINAFDGTVLSSDNTQDVFNDVSD